MKKKTIAYTIAITIAIAFATLFFIALGIGFLKSNYKISIGVFIFTAIIDTICIIIAKRNIKTYEWKPKKEPKYITVKDYTEMTEKETESEKAITEIIKNWKEEENK